MLAIEIDESLLAEAMEATGQSTRQSAVEEALRRVVQLQKQKLALEKLAGIGWDGDLAAMREGRSF